MKIKNIHIKNFRLLNDCNINFDSDLNIIIGKNNTGKTSMLYCLEKFINSNKNNLFRFEDLSIQLQGNIEKLLIDDEVKSVKEYNESYKGILMEMIIVYDEKDNISTLSKLMTDLSDDKNEITLCFKYDLQYENYIALKKDFIDFKNKVGDIKSASWFLTRNSGKYFTMRRYGYDVDENNSIELDSSLISDIINFSYIDARRDVTNDIPLKTGNIRAELSKLSYNYLKNKKDDELKDKVEELNKILLEMDSKLDLQYQNIFKDFLDDLLNYGIADEGSKMEIQSRLSDINIVQDNTLMLYDVDGKKLPETYNGLGFLNFYALIMQINSILMQFQSYGNTCMNILLIEEPEAHTHPQMQYIFINNIKKIIVKYKENINLCTIITTHSPQIVSQADYDDLIVFVRTDKINTDVRSFMKFMNQYKYSKKDEEKETYKFLKNYLTLTNSEIFFTDKLIICEGTTERILLPLFIKICDEKKITSKKLQSQKYSIIESGTYSQKLQPFFDLLGIKTLIITDIDFCKGPNHTKCNSEEATCTSNSIIKYYAPDLSIDELKKQENVFVKNNVGLTFQHKENGYHARSFEDAYISLNYSFLKDNFEFFGGLKCKKIFLNGDFYEIGNNCIESKSTFATEIAYYSGENFNNIIIPSYIKEGIKWIAD